MGPPKVMWLGPSQSCNENPGPSISSWSPSLKWRKAPSILSPLCNWLIMKPAPLSLTQLSHNSFVTCHILGTPTNSRVPFVVRPTVAVILHIRKKVKLLPSGRQRADHESKQQPIHPPSSCPACPPAGVWGEPRVKEKQPLHRAVAQRARPTDSMLGMKPKRACLPKNSHEKSSHESSQLCTNLYWWKCLKTYFMASLTWWCKIQN